MVLSTETKVVEPKHLSRVQFRALSIRSFWGRAMSHIEFEMTKIKFEPRIKLTRTYAHGTVVKLLSREK